MHHFIPDSQNPLRFQPEPNPYGVSIKVKEDLSPMQLAPLTVKFRGLCTSALEGGGTEVICPNEDINCVNHVTREQLEETLRNYGLTVVEEGEDDEK